MFYHQYKCIYYFMTHSLLQLCSLRKESSSFICRFQQQITEGFSVRKSLFILVTTHNYKYSVILSVFSNRVIPCCSYRKFPFRPGRNQKLSPDEVTHFSTVQLLSERKQFRFYTSKESVSKITSLTVAASSSTFAS